MATTITAAAASAMADALNTYIGNTAKIRIYDDVAPTDASTALAGGNTALVEFTLASPGFGEDGDGVLDLVTTPALTEPADVGGTATFFRILKSDGTTVVLQGSVSATGGGGQLELNTTNLSTGVDVTITGGTITVPKS